MSINLSENEYRALMKALATEKRVHELTDAISLTTADAEHGGVGCRLSFGDSDGDGISIYFN
jgi:hypothetical protein